MFDVSPGIQVGTDTSWSRVDVARIEEVTLQPFAFSAGAFYRLERFRYFLGHQSSKNMYLEVRPRSERENFGGVDLRLKLSNWTFHWGAVGRFWGEALNFFF